MKNKYHGITYEIEKWKTEKMKMENCSNGIHAFDEVWSIEAHYLHCDYCGLEVHIKEIIERKS